MDHVYQQRQSQRILRQRNILGVVAVFLGLGIFPLTYMVAKRDREIVLQPVLQSSVTVSSAGVSREYLEMITRDTALLTLNRSPQNLDYWMKQILDITSPRTQGKVKADLLKIVEEQRGSSISQYFLIEAMTVDPKKLRSTVTGKLHTVVGQKVVSTETRIFQFEWEYTGLSLKLVGFGMVVADKKKEDV